VGAGRVPLGSGAADRYLGNASARILWLWTLTDEEGALCSSPLLHAPGEVSGA
jgi:hypothetical protein